MKDGSGREIPTISREELIDITKLALASFDGDDNYVVTPELRLKCMGVAEGAEVIAAGTWWIHEEAAFYLEELNGCGCLVGWIHKGEISRGVGHAGTEYRLGLRFDDLLMRRLSSQVEALHYRGYVLVSDDG